jgi:hypothetical protein
MESPLPANNYFLAQKAWNTAAIYGVFCIEDGILPAQCTKWP